MVIGLVGQEHKGLQDYAPGCLILCQQIQLLLHISDGSNSDKHHGHPFTRGIRLAGYIIFATVDITLVAPVRVIARASDQ
jgi:hypothetical protein